MIEEKNKREIVKICHKIYDKGFVTATDGNVSVRLDGDRIMTTPSGLSKGDVTEESLIVTDMEGKKIAGEGKPSSEIRMHLQAYKDRPDIRAVIHAHPPISTAFSIAGLKMAQCVLPEVVLTMGSIPTTEYATPTTAEGPEVIKPYIKEYDAMILDRHGTLTVGETLQKAFEKLEKIEHCAHITLMARQLGRVSTLSPDQVEKLISLREKLGIKVKRGGCSNCGACLGSVSETNAPFNIEIYLELSPKKFGEYKKKCLREFSTMREKFLTFYN